MAWLASFRCVGNQCMCLYVVIWDSQCLADVGSLSGAPSWLSDVLCVTATLTDQKRDTYTLVHAHPPPNVHDGPLLADLHIVRGSLHRQR